MPPVQKTKEQTLAWLRTISGELATATLKRLDDTLPWYGDMPPGRRSAVGLVAQAGITSFISWFDDPKSIPWIAADVFGAAPRELLRSVSLTQTLQLIRITVEVVEERVKDGDDVLREAILLYSREIAFAAADVYARAAEARGLWDARLEALVVDSILSGEYDNELPSRIARAIRTRPMIFGGTDRFDSTLVEETSGRVIAKIGAEGIHSAALLDLGIGAVVKVEDGSMRAQFPALLRLLQLHGALPDPLPARLQDFARTRVKNTRGEVVGEVRVVDG